MKEKKPVDPRSEGIRLVLGHLISNPDAKDTAEGILKWWMPKGNRKLKQDELEKVLASLVSQGWVIERTVTDQKKLYALNRKVVGEVKRYLNDND